MSIFAALLLALTMAAQRATPPSQRPEGEKEPSWFVKAKPRQRPSSWETLASAIGDSAETAAEPETDCLLYTSPSPRDKRQSRMPSSA